MRKNIKGRKTKEKMIFDVIDFLIRRLKRKCTFDGVIQPNLQRNINLTRMTNGVR